MSAAAAVLTFLGVAVLVLSALGVAVMDGVLDRLHYVGPSSLGLTLIVAAIWVQEGPSLIGIKGALLAAVVLFTAPALAHATAVAAHIRAPEQAEDVEVEEG